MAMPSLDLRFSRNNSLTDAVSGLELVTFTRASAGTYVDRAGILQTAVNNAPRFDHNPTTGESLGLLVEEQRTNLLVRSEEFSDATSWLASNASITANAVIAPNGLQIADKLIEDTAASIGHFVRPAPSPSITAGQSYTYSVFAKAAERTFLQLIFVGAGPGGANLVAGFDLITGSAGTPSAGTASVARCGNGWFRCSFTITASTTATTQGQIRLSQNSSNSSSSYTGDGTSGIYIWGAQLEAGAFPTSYIPTTTAAATRSADVASISGSSFSSWYWQDEGSNYMLFSEPVARTDIRTPRSLSDGTFSNRIDGSLATTFNSRFSVSGSAFNPTSIGYRTSPLTNALIQGFSVGSFTTCLNGVLSSTVSPTATPVVNRLNIGSDSVGSTVITGHIRRLTYWPFRLPNIILQAITQ